MEKNRISVTVLVKNAERTLEAVLSALSAFDEILLYDTGSTDNTLRIASQYPKVTLYQKPFIGFGACHNDAACLAQYDWILSIDADEVLSKELVEELLNLHLNPQCVYALPFHNYYNDKWIRWCGWYPESHIRLYHRGMTSFSEAKIHEGILKKSHQKHLLKHPVRHYSYGSIADFLHKMQHYSTLFAEQYKYKKSSSIWSACGHGVWAFFKSFVIKWGFLGGYEGFLISSYNAHTAFYKYLKLYEANRR